MLLWGASQCSPDWTATWSHLCPTPKRGTLLRAVCGWQGQGKAGLRLPLAAIVKQQACGIGRLLMTRPVLPDPSFATDGGMRP